MMRVKVTSLTSKFKEGVVEKRTQKVLRESAHEIASVAEQLAPKRTGALAESIHVEETDAIRVVVGKSYGKYPEYGTVHQAPQPYLRPAVNAERKRVRARLGQIEKGLGDALGTKTRVVKNIG